MRRWEDGSPQQLLSNRSEKLLPVQSLHIIVPSALNAPPRGRIPSSMPLYLMNLVVPGNSLLDLNSPGNACGRWVGLGRPALLGQNLPWGLGCLQVAL